MTDSELADYVKKKKYEKEERVKRSPLYDRAAAPDPTKSTSFVARLLRQTEADKAANLKPEIAKQREKEVAKIARAQAFRKPIAAPPASTSRESLGDDVEDPLLHKNRAAEDDDWIDEEAAGEDQEEDSRLAELQERRELGYISNRLQVIKRRGRLRFFAVMESEQKTKLIQALREARKLHEDPRKQLVSAADAEKIKSEWGTKVGQFPQAPTKKHKLDKFAELFTEIRRLAKIRSNNRGESDESADGLINVRSILLTTMRL